MEKIIIHIFVSKLVNHVYNYYYTKSILYPEFLYVDIFDVGAHRVC